MKIEDRKSLVSVAEIAEMMEVSPATVRSYAWRDPQFPEVKERVGRSPMRDKAEVEAYISARHGRVNGGRRGNWWRESPK
uniref:Helix-turn-helix domain-containing protein n=2 Tax=Brevibacterium TaxID=1696 RepID=U5NZH2_9MICO|nr:hypothetical protein AP13_p00010 [Brevibacterium sp. Ap13]